MKCAYVFHLLPMPHVHKMERQVVVAYDYDNPTYEVFRPKVHSQFPDIEKGSGIFATSHTFQGPGTYVKAYCSFTLSTVDIVGKIFQGQTPVTDTSHLDFGANEEKERECLNYIQRLSVAADQQEGLKISQIRKHKGCLDITLAHLAYRGLISIQGTYSGYAPTGISEVTKIDADEPINIAEVLLTKQFFEWDFKQEGTYAVAWYMGHLHIFTRCMWGNHWRPITYIGTPRENYGLIRSKFFYNHGKNIDFMNLVKRCACSPRRKGSIGKWLSCVPSDEENCTIKAVRKYNFGHFSSPLPIGDRRLLG
ncbi:Bgt-51151 [Blumeria graminis f. sp. tritici]|uniref:Bgt-51151 n=1 Tax=Blumeria graminis f. sp. tritici TaxID=62690 RepID=A0A9X9MI22_BLUGR|nr:Bgt-51151 [Blumeria graminis f. sp. tritici]